MAAAGAIHLDLEITTGRRLAAVVHAFEVLRAALDVHGHRWTDEEEAALEAAADALEANLRTEDR